MTIKFKLPDIGENIDTAQVVSLLVNAGDTVEEGQPVLELETDKATVEVPSPESGTIQEIHVEEGQEIEVGQLLLTLSAPDEADTTAENGDETQQDKAEEAQDQPSPKETNEAEAELEAEQPAQSKAEDDPDAAEINGKETKEAKTDADDDADTEDTEAEANKNAETRAETSARDTTEERAKKVQPETERQPESSQEEDVILASASTHRLAQELDVDLTSIEGSGPGGSITTEDVKRQLRLNSDQPAPAELSLPDFSRWGEIKREQMTGIRRTTAKRLSLA